MVKALISHLPKVYFVDPCSAGGYDLNDLKSRGLGGTEATILRVSSALQSAFDVSHFQNGRSIQSTSEAGRFQSLADAYRTSKVAVIVVINRWKIALKLRKVNPGTPIFLWLHTYPGRHNRKMGVALKEAAITVICVSTTHARLLSEFLGPFGLPRISVIYNPIADHLVPDDTQRDPDTLLYASSPHKGLAEVFAQFSDLRETIPKLTLAVADPGYLRWETGPVPDGVTFLGALSHPELVQHMRRSLCLFYPQTTFAETFGLVLAEANAVGAPVLVNAGLGANDEIVSGADQKIDGRDPAQILSRIEMWRSALPEVNTNPAFRLTNVAQRWSELLLDAMATQAPLLEEVN